MERVRATGVISDVEHIGLRYINFFDSPIMDRINVEITMIDHRLTNERANLRAELQDEDFRKVVQGNQVEVTVGNQTTTGSVIDIDFIKSTGCSGDVFFVEYRDLVETAHEKEKELFFSLLKAEFIASLNPEYGE